MKNHVQTLHALILAAFTLFRPNIQAASPYFFVQEPETLIAEVGTFVAFSAKVSLPASAVYQWQFGQLVSGTNYWKDVTDATNRDLVIPTPTVDHVGAYRLQVWWGPTNVVSSTAFLSVYELQGTNSTAGTLTTSALQFGIPPSPGTYACPYYPGERFNKFYNPTNSSGVFYFFYGPNVATSAQSGPFINSGHNNYIRITTAGGFNNPTHTGVRYLSSFDPPGYPPYDCGCEAGDSTLTPDLTYYLMSTSPSQQLARYRVTIYYTTPAPSNGNIVMNWTYF